MLFNTNVKAILFDLDGTLADTDNQMVTRLAGLLRPLVHPLHLDANLLSRRLLMWIETPGNLLFSLFDVVGLDDNIFALGDWLHRLRGLHARNHLPLIQDIKPALQVLHNHYRLGLVTTRGQRDVLAFLEQHGLTSVFDVVVTRESTRRLKPHPSPVLLAARQLGLPVQACVMVGDTVVDVRAARAAGAWSVAVLCGFGERKELENEGAHVVLDSTAQIINLCCLPTRNVLDTG